MFEPIEFAVLAHQLVVGSLDADLNGREVSEECRLRAAIGRAYYALYLATRAVIVRRHGVPTRKLAHGTLYTCLQHSRMSSEVRRLGHELQRLYNLRQKADYELDLGGPWHARVTDSRHVDLASKQVIATSRDLHRLDFSAVAELLRSQ